MTNEEINENMEAGLKIIFNSCNYMGGEKERAEILAKVLQSEHRTIQQSFMRVFKMAMVEYSESNTDGRNESAVALAKEIANSNEYLPFI